MSSPNQFQARSGELGLRPGARERAAGVSRVLARDGRGCRIGRRRLGRAAARRRRGASSRHRARSNRCPWARSRYDSVVEEPIGAVGSDVIGEANFLIVADTLEHLLDPWEILRRLYGLSAPNARLAVSVPNLRHVGVLGPALLWGRFDYTDSGGLMDRGHLRWFTRASLEGSLTACGWVPTASSGAFGTGKRALVNRTSRQVLSGLLAHQVYVLASQGSFG